MDTMNNGLWKGDDGRKDWKAFQQVFCRRYRPNSRLRPKRRQRRLGEDKRKGRKIPLDFIFHHGLVRKQPKNQSIHRAKPVILTDVYIHVEAIKITFNGSHRSRRQDSFYSFFNSLRMKKLSYNKQRIASLAKVRNWKGLPGRNMSGDLEKKYY